MPHRVIKSIDGRRGGALTLIALLLLLLGGSQIRPRAGRSESLSWLPEWFGNNELGFVVAGAGALVLLLALVSKKSRHALAGGYILAFVTLGLLGLLYLGTALAGASQTFAYGLLFLTLAVLVLYISGWDEERPYPPLTEAQKHVLLNPPDRDGAGDVA